MSDIVDSLKTIVAAVVVIGVMLVGLVALNRYANERNEVKCAAVGGEYYRAADASKSLCRIPK